MNGNKIDKLITDFQYSRRNILQTAKFSLSSTVEQPIAPLSIALKSNAFKIKYLKKY